MRLIERESQLAALRQYGDEASQGSGRLVLISGEAGVGKSVLLEESAHDLNDARWLWAGCDGLFTPAALGPLLDLASQLDGELLRLCHAEAKRNQLYGALLQQLGNLQSFTVLVIEDVHWADEATLDLLSYLGRRIQHLPVLLLSPIATTHWWPPIHCVSRWERWQSSERPAGSAWQRCRRPASRPWRKVRRSTPLNCTG